jgi:hypothetical protein
MGVYGALRRESVSPKDPTTKTLPAGAVFHRCALQGNPHHYSGTFRGQEVEGDPRAYAETIVAKATEVGVSVLAITDHNSASGVPAFRDAAEGTGITIFPGFEPSSSEGIHVLCIYPPDTPEDQLGRFLGEFGIRTTMPSPDLSDKTFAEVLEKARTQGGITIAAHAASSASDRGLFGVLSGQSRIKAWRSENLLAIQIPGTVEDLPQDVRQIVEGKDPNYQRSHPAGQDLAVAVEIRVLRRTCEQE